MSQQQQPPQQQAMVPYPGIPSQGPQMGQMPPQYPPSGGVAPSQPVGMPAPYPGMGPMMFTPYREQHKQQMSLFWQQQMQEVEQTNDFKNHQLPLARVKKIMKADEDVRMISAEAPVVFAKACEMFILELTLRAWINTEENKRRTLQRNDIAAAIGQTDIFDFLVDIVPRDEYKEEPLYAVRPDAPGSSGVYYMPQQPPAAGAPPGAPSPMMGQPMMGQPMMMYQQQDVQQANMQQMWQQQQQQMPPNNRSVSPATS